MSKETLSDKERFAILMDAFSDNAMSTSIEDLRAESAEDCGDREAVEALIESGVKMFSIAIEKYENDEIRAGVKYRNRIRSLGALRQGTHHVATEVLALFRTYQDVVATVRSRIFALSSIIAPMPSFGGLVARGRMDKKPLSELVGGPMASGISAFGALMASVVFYVWTKNQPVEVMMEILSTLTVGLLFYISFELFMRVFVLRQMHDRISRVSTLIDHVGRSDILKNKLTLLSQEDQLISYIGRTTVTSFITRFEVANNGKRLTLRGADLTISALITFWEGVIEMQRRFKLRNLIARVTHSNGVVSYSDCDDPATFRLYMLQKEFIQSGGQIFRILIETAATDTHHRRLNDYVSAMQKMESIGIVTAYISLDNRQKGDGLSRLDQDILLIDPTLHSISWDLERGHTPVGCRISAERSDYDIHRRTWRALIDRLTSGSPGTAAEEYRPYLERHHMAFLNALPRTDLTP